jgi:hypothetical protein
MINTADSPPGASQYLFTVRKSYATLMHVAQVLEASQPTEGLQAHHRNVAETVAAYVERLVWADHQLVPGEYAALDALVDEDAQHGDRLAELLRIAGNEPHDLTALPVFLATAADYDRAHGTRLAGSAINALESMGLALLASDREIALEEMQLLHETVGAWRESSLALARA